MKLLFPQVPTLRLESLKYLTCDFLSNDHPLLQPQRHPQSQARSVPSLSLVEVGEECKGRDQTSHRWISNHSALPKWILNHNALLSRYPTPMHLKKCISNLNAFNNGHPTSKHFSHLRPQLHVKVFFLQPPIKKKQGVKRKADTTTADPGGESAEEKKPARQVFFNNSVHQKENLNLNILLD